MKDDFYIGEDGLEYCSKCKTPRQILIESKLLGKKVFSCMCKCQREEYQKTQIQQREEEIRLAKEKCFGKKNDCTFECDDRKNEKLSNAMRKYARDFKHYRDINKGLLLYGDKGTGKSFYAACIANELIEAGFRVRMTTFNEIANKLWDCEDKDAFYRSLNQNTLLIIDDLGVERSSEYMSEIVFQVIDNRVKAKKPMIITTNLDIRELSTTEDINKGRIYDRILQYCHPIKFEGNSKRIEQARNEYKKINEELGL